MEPCKPSCDLVSIADCLEYFGVISHWVDGGADLVVAGACRCGSHTTSCCSTYLGLVLLAFPDATCLGLAYLPIKPGVVEKGTM